MKNLMALMTLRLLMGFSRLFCAFVRVWWP
jgi:hypothetical protein